MSYPARLMRKRKVMDERTPSGESVDELVRRLAPSILPVLAEAPPVMPPAPQPSVPLVQPVVRGEIPNNIVPPDPVMAPTRPRLINPVDPVLKAKENLDASMVAPPDFGQMKLRNPTTGQVEIDPETGKALTVQRTKPRGGFMGRLEAGLKLAGRLAPDILAQSGNPAAGAGAGIASLIAGIANPGLNAKLRLQDTQGLNRQEYGNQVAARGEQIKLGDMQSQIALRNAQANKILNPVEKVIYRKQGGVTYRIGEDGKAAPLVDTQGNELPPEINQPHVREVLAEDGVTKILSQWNPKSNSWEDVTRGGEPARTGYTPKINPESGMTPAQEKAARDREAGLQIRRSAESRQQGNVVTGDARKQVEVEAFNANIDRQTQELKKEQLANEAIVNNPNATPYDRDQARRRAQQVRDEIGRIERQKKAPFVPRTVTKNPLGLKF